MIKADMSGFGVTMHSGLSKQYVKFDVLFRTRPCVFWQQTPAESNFILYTMFKSMLLHNL